MTSLRGDWRSNNICQRRSPPGSVEGIGVSTVHRCLACGFQNAGNKESGNVRNKEIV